MYRMFVFEENGGEESCYNFFFLSQECKRLRGTIRYVWSQDLWAALERCTSPRHVRAPWYWWWGAWRAPCTFATARLEYKSRSKCISRILYTILPNQKSLFALSLFPFFNYDFRFHVSTFLHARKIEIVNKRTENQFIIIAEILSRGAM